MRQNLVYDFVREGAAGHEILDDLDAVIRAFEEGLESGFERLQLGHVFTQTGDQQFR